MNNVDIRKIVGNGFINVARQLEYTLEDATITEDNEVKGIFITKEGVNNWVYIRFTKDFEIALVQHYDDSCSVLEDIEIYRWSRYEKCYAKAEFV